MQKRIVIASANLGKIKEFQQIFAQYNIDVVPQADLNVSEIEEPFSTLLKILFTKHATALVLPAYPHLLMIRVYVSLALGGAP